MLTNALQGPVIETIDRLITGPNVEPLDLEEAKKYLRFTPTSEDTLIDTMISAARQYFEDQTGVICLSQTWELGVGGTPYQNEIELTKWPAQSVTSVEYDVDGVATAMSTSDYRLLTGTNRIRLETGASWPTFTVPVSAGLRIRYVAGYGDAPGDVPEIVRWAIGMLLGSMHKVRAETHEETDGSLVAVPFGAAQIIRDYKWKHKRTLVPRWASWV